MKLILLAVASAVIILFSYEFIFVERGSITGEYIQGWSEGYGDFCGQYPSCAVKLVNYSVDGNIWDYGNGKFYFGNQYDEVLDLTPGCIYKFNYHKSSRSSDTTSGSDIEFYVLDGVETL